MSTIQDQIDKEREAARNTCKDQGEGSVECAIAWDTVEELQAEAAHQRQKVVTKNSLQEYCDDNPDALECRVYDN
jgi:peptide subunit release factor 1 (eRF1)